MAERTLSMIKPDAVSKNLIGEILRRLESASLKIVALRMIRLTPEEARKFYDIHRERPFFEGLVKFMCSGPVVVMALEGEDAVLKTRALMGATNPKDAAKGTLRGDFGAGIEENVIHGSDAKETAVNEIAFFFDRLP